MGKLSGNRADRTSNFCDLEDFAYVHSPDHACGNYRAQKRPSGPGKKAHKTGKNEGFCIYSSKLDGPVHPYGLQVLGAQPMDGYNRVLGSH